MLNMWGFLIQTLEVSFMAVLLLGIKYILRDKLSPKWQYGIWCILCITMIMPAGMYGTYMLPLVSVYLETIKAIVESSLQSVYTIAFLPVHNISFLPFVKTMPHSFTDVLFIVYIIGIFVFLIRYIFQYMNLKKILNQSHLTNNNIIHQVERVAETYHLKTCQTIIVDKFPTAFLCGMIHPVLVIPANMMIDDKIILHELLHYKYKDSLQCVIWSIMRCLHWCNPFMHYVFNQINNDMESLCDQRVLELIKGEERRDYGRILLSMTNEKYPHAFATSSLSNGGKNIKKRIEAIARFKKYPKGMSLVSICIGILLLPLAITGISTPQLIEDYSSPDSFEYQKAMASARMQKCNTVAGAIDTYAKGLLTSNDFYIASVISKKQINDYQSVLQNKIQNIRSYSNDSLYKIMNLRQVNSKEYRGELLFHDYHEAENFIEFVSIPIAITKEVGWKVEQIGRTNKKHEVIIRDASVPRGTFHFIEDFEALSDGYLQQDCETGTIALTLQTVHLVKQDYANSFHPSMNNMTQDLGNDSSGTIHFGSPYQRDYSMKPNMNAEFERSWQSTKVVYTNKNIFEEYPKTEALTLLMNRVKNKNNQPTFREDHLSQVGIDATFDRVSYTSGDSSFKCIGIQKDWEGKMSSLHIVDNQTNDAFEFPQYLDLRIYANTKMIEEVKIDLGEVQYVQ